jgi:carboxypeptidase PM20D1
VLRFLLVFWAVYIVGGLALAQPRKTLPVADVLQQYIRIPSESGFEKPAGEFLLNYCKDIGLHTVVFTDLDSSYNFAASLFPLTDRKPALVFQHHIDVVPAEEPYDWTFPPYEAIKKDGIIYGRGALDAKGIGIMQLYALLKFKETYPNWQSLPFNVVILALSGEETGGKNGAKIIVDRFLPLLNPFAVIGEGGAGIRGIVPGKPSQDIIAISVAEKSNLWLRLDLKFRSSGHSSTPPRKSVNKAMIRALNRVNDLDGSIKFNKTSKRMFKEFGHLVGGTTGFVMRHPNWWIFRSGFRKAIEKEPIFDAMMRNTTILTNIANPPGPLNQIANRISAFMDCRLLPGTNPKAFLRSIQFKMLEPNLEITVLDAGPSSEESDPKHIVFRSLAKASENTYPGAKAIPILFQASTDNNYFREKGIPTYGLNPVMLEQGTMESIHSINERISEQNLESGISLYTQLIQLLAQEKNLPVGPYDVRTPASDNSRTK